MSRPTMVDRALALVAGAGSACVRWPGSLNAAGYAVAWDGRRMTLGHRVIFELVAGPIPDGLHLDHLCRNTWCVNPAHLEPVTQAVNNQRSYAARYGYDPERFCKNGHPKTIETRYRGRCKQCHAANERAYRARRAVVAS